MPAQLPIAKVLRTIFSQTIGQNPNIENKIYVQYTGTAPTEAQMATYNSKMLSDYKSLFLPQMTTLDAINETKTVDLTNTGSAEVSDGASMVGSLPSTTAMFPPTVTIMANFAIASRYRGGHPRWYQSGIQENEINENGVVSSAAIGKWSGIIAGLLNATTGSGWTGAGTLTPGMVSYYQKHTWAQDHLGNWHRIPTPRNPPIFHPILGVSVLGVATSQSRRLAFVA